MKLNKRNVKKLSIQDSKHRRKKSSLKNFKQLEHEHKLDPLDHKHNEHEHSTHKKYRVVHKS